MSEPVTNVEIEDVLSSIRRLISDDVIAVRKPVNKVTERFVLTPALRVKDATSAEINPDSRKPVSTAKSTPVLAETESVLAVVQEEPEGLGPEKSEGEWEQVADAVTDGGFSSSRSTLEARIAELEVAVGRTREAWEPDGSEPDAAEIPERHIFMKSAPPAVPDEADHQEDRAETTSEASLTLAEVLVTDDAPIEDEEKGRLTADSLIDEDALKELVAGVVREQLLGALGERITRNVRRMVRREIQQALALKDLE